ncbi:hypothetical protein NDU88_004952 [Pleurodeles waltl]|uniref:Uncharacterized protein n=1 Tax=Pleurodeles waltl TaxID=8319 RepID=A0AAV7WY55_PLEWA|nr:hypothetical protein NDU88_004952 [Pleurodeles waltl]
MTGEDGHELRRPGQRVQSVCIMGKNRSIGAWGMKSHPGQKFGSCLSPLCASHAACAERLYYGQKQKRRSLGDEVPPRAEVRKLHLTFAAERLYYGQKQKRRSLGDEIPPRAEARKFPLTFVRVPRSVCRASVLWAKTEV